MKLSDGTAQVPTVGAAGIDPEYLRLLLLYFEEEIMGEAYFLALAEANGTPDQRAKLVLLARVERHAADMVVPLLRVHGLRPRADAELRSLGEVGAARDRNLGWTAFIDDMATRYPRFIDEFVALERLAPGEDLPALKRLTHHEVVTIEFAERERSGDPDSTLPLRAYLEDPAA